MEIRVENSGEFAYLMEEFANIIRNSEKNSENNQYNLTFGQALEALKSGKRVSRKGWNGKGMYLFIMKGGLSGAEVHKQHEYLDDKIEIQDCICMKTVQNTVCVGWLASQTDMLAEDWEIIE